MVSPSKSESYPFKRIQRIIENKEELNLGVIKRAISKIGFDSKITMDDDIDFNYSCKLSDKFTLLVKNFKDKIIYIRFH